MCNRVSAFRVRFMGQAAAIAVLAGFGAACSADATRVKEPFFTGSTANQRAIIGNTAPTPGYPNTTAVASAPLPQQGTGGPINLASSSQGGAWTAVGGTVVTVQNGESLDTLAIKYGVPSNEIARANAISSPSQITPGRAVVIPKRTQAAYAAPQPTPTPQVTQVSAPSPINTGGVHTVESGQTLYGIARTYNVSVSEVVAANNLQSQTVRIGQKLTIPGAGSPAPKTQTAATGTAPKPLGTLTVASPAPAEAAPTMRVVSANKTPDDLPVVPVKASAPATNTVAVVDEPADPPSTNGTSFRWPVRGRIISGYGAKADGERNDGINLAVPEGTSVKAAEAGTVIYSGNELAGYGNLVLVRHADGWVSAYAHNSSINVKRGDTVQRGSIIGKAGATGSVSSPQVHFELRKGAKPVNPMDYLTGT